MVKKSEKKFNDLRKKAQEILTGKNGISKETLDEFEEIIHELEVHQIELEMQNENLIKVQIELEESKEEYKELYDFAPVGYFNLDKNCIIKKTNLKAFEILGIPRKYLINTAFIRYVAPESRKIFHDHCQEVKESPEKVQTELKLLSPNKKPFLVSLTTIKILDRCGSFKEYRSVITDVATSKEVEVNINKS